MYILLDSKFQILKVSFFCTYLQYHNHDCSTFDCVQSQSRGKPTARISACYQNLTNCIVFPLKTILP